MPENTLYDKSFEHDNCGVGFIADIGGKRSNEIIEKSLAILKNLEHRGATGVDPNSGDGAGILTEIPHELFLKFASLSSIAMPERGSYGAGMAFMPGKAEARQRIEKDIEEIVSAMGGEILLWRSVPVDPLCLGEAARAARPDIRQFIVKFGSLSGDELEKKLYTARRLIEKKEEKEFSINDFYIPSLSAYTIVYKGLFIAPQLGQFYSDLSDSSYKSCFAIVHQRYSTNTFPSWPLAQPFRHIAHNGEINTIRGNISRMKAREKTIIAESSDSFYGNVMPVINENLSDSGCFDNVYELLLKSGRSAAHSMMMMVPEPFSDEYHISQDRRAFYRYHAALMEPWDGPAALVFTDGKMVGASLDRNGLRPARWTITAENKFILASEAGVLRLDNEEIRSNGRLSPGRMVIVDFTRKRVLYDNEIKALETRRKPYRKWLSENLIDLRNLLQLPGENIIEKPDILRLSSVFGYTEEDISVTLKTMAEEGHEPVISMGDDTPLAVLSEKPRLLYSCFRQFFAQVTNPPIDPLREKIVMSLMSFIGRERNLLEETPGHCRQLKLNHPVLTNDDIDKLIEIDMDGQRTDVLKMFFYCSRNSSREENGAQLEKSLELLCSKTEERIDMGATFVVLSDKNLEKGQVPIPALLAVSAVHNYLAARKKRHLAGLVVETGEAREVMHFASLINAGASAVNPYLAFEIISYMKEREKINPEIKLEAAFENYIEAIKQGLLKIMSKMGISTIRSYRGSKTLEAVGLSKDFTERYFPGIVSRIGGIGLEEAAISASGRYFAAVSDDGAKKGETYFKSSGFLHYRKGGEKHLMSPGAVVYLQRAVRNSDYDEYKRYAEEIEERSSKNITLRSLFAFRKGEPVPLEEVESEELIVKRFVSSAMSLGSLSMEAHRTIALAMNRLGSASNSGEGGEEESRVIKEDSRESTAGKVRQIASGRFGVNSHYLANAMELQIKIAQGAKPGEGGQLPGYKVNSIIADVRYSTPGVTLISPPPHHDIYSIEDLSQLIYDLRNANPAARISVKLVSEAGVGTVASGVAKAGADMVLISGHDGGTGAAPVSSVKYAGLPWELGLAETQQTLVRNNLRSSIRVQTDGQLRTGRDVAVAALLGADEFGFGTVSLVALGCIMMRKCHKNCCPVGIATQDEELRRRFAGKPEHLMNFMIFTARHLREIMASLGFRSVDEMTGRHDMLEVDTENTLAASRHLDFSAILSAPLPPAGKRQCSSWKNKPDLTDPLEETLVREVLGKMEKNEKAFFSSEITNINRSVGARLSYHVSKKGGPRGLPEGSVKALFRGIAGQSFAAFLAGGITFTIRGALNDYPGKGLSGGILAASPGENMRFRASRNVIAGNAALYGATSGQAYFCGVVGERFCVRNSGAVAVAEGTGDHSCEYMTGGRVAVLGKTGSNFAAGMSGGVAYVLDEDQLFDTRCNLEMVDIEPVSMERDRQELKSMIADHVRYTESELGRNILFHWEEMWPLFVKVVPFEYGAIMKEVWEREEKELQYGQVQGVS